jgi:hypothetical protein
METKTTIYPIQCDNKCSKYNREMLQSILGKEIKVFLHYAKDSDILLIELSQSNPDSSFGNKEAHKCSLDRNISVVEKSGNDIKLCDDCSMPGEYCECKFK